MKIKRIAFRILQKISACIIGFLFIWLISCKPEKPIPDETIYPSPHPAITHQYLYDICIDSLDVTDYTVESGDNLSSIFARLGLANLSDSLQKVAAGLIEPRKLRAGSGYRTLTSNDENESVRYIIFVKSLTDHVIIDLTQKTITARLYHKESSLRQRYIEGSVKSSLWNEIKKQGANPVLAVKIADVFAWQIDFFSIQENDSFQVLYTEALIDDSIPTGIASIDGAIFIHSGHPYMAIPFTQDSSMQYFDAEGQSLRKAFLKAPLDFFRITSRFTNARFHPVLKRYRAHHGVDYAAPSGTPVKSIGDGKVIAKGYQRGGGGNYMKIQHNTTYTTTYMHLRGFAKGIKVGAHVRQGEVIAYVGSTGLSTGPHLDFRVFKNGTPIDPLKMESPPSYPIKPELKDSFEIVKQHILDSFKQKAPI